MRLIHYSAKPLRQIYSMQQDEDIHTSPKPRGLWVSISGESDWPEWCRSEGFRLGDLTCETDVDLRPDANVLRMSTPEELDLFSAEYADDRYGNGLKWAVRWSAVAARFQGIIIAPYIWQRRLTAHTSWYYGWDCASGCIWDAAAVRVIEAIAASRWA